MSNSEIFKSYLYISCLERKIDNNFFDMFSHCLIEDGKLKGFYQFPIDLSCEKNISTIVMGEFPAQYNQSEFSCFIKARNLEDTICFNRQFQTFLIVIIENIFHNGSKRRIQIGSAENSILSLNNEYFIDKKLFCITGKANCLPLITNHLK